MVKAVSVTKRFSEKTGQVYFTLDFDLGFAEPLKIFIDKEKFSILTNKNNLEVSEVSVNSPILIGYNFAVCHSRSYKKSSKGFDYFLGIFDLFYEECSLFLSIEQALILTDYKYSELISLPLDIKKNIFEVKGGE